MRLLMEKRKDELENNFSHENQKDFELIADQNSPPTIQKKKDDEKHHKDRSKYL